MKASNQDSREPPNFEEIRSFLEGEVRTTERISVCREGGITANGIWHTHDTPMMAPAMKDLTHQLAALTPLVKKCSAIALDPGSTNSLNSVPRSERISRI